MHGLGSEKSRRIEPESEDERQNGSEKAILKGLNNEVSLNDLESN